MPEPELLHRRHSQRASLRPSADWTPLPPVAVGGRRYERRRDPDGREFVEVPGVAGTADTEPIPARLLRFVGAPVCVEISIRQANQFVAAQATGVAGGFAGCLTGWSVALDGVVVYGRMGPTAEVLPAALDAAASLRRLLALPLDLTDRAAWEGRPIYLDGRPATVAGLTPSHGTVTVRVLGPDDGAHVGVDLLSDRIWWDREPSPGPAVGGNDDG